MMYVMHVWSMFIYSEAVRASRKADAGLGRADKALWTNRGEINIKMWKY